MILLAYDGSKDARSAIERAGELFAGEAATVLVVWEPFQGVLARTGANMTAMAGITDYIEIDRGYQEAARERAEEGVGLARSAGLDARAKLRRRDLTIAEAILDEADQAEARVIVLGTRGLTGIKSALLGSVSQAVLHRTDRPVMVVPSPEVARERSEHRRGNLSP
jgi:nucleotide-binding universal stress UspA family protein